MNRLFIIKVKQQNIWLIIYIIPEKRIFKAQADAAKPKKATKDKDDKDEVKDEIKDEGTDGKDEEKDEGKDEEVKDDGKDEKKEESKDEGKGKKKGNIGKYFSARKEDGDDN